MPLEKLLHHFGNSYGQYLYEAARGIDESLMVTHWGTEIVQPRDHVSGNVREWQVIARTLADLSKEVVLDMRDIGTKARTVTIKIRFSDFETFTRAMTIADYTDSEEEIRRRHSPV